jgi:KipI family sensor histidine kinase inhibitor
MPSASSTRSVPVGEIRRFGECALLIGVEDPPAARALTRALRAAHLEGLHDAVGGLATVMAVFDTEGDHLDARLPQLTHLVEEVLRRPAEADDGGRLVVLPCRFDGPDLDEVAELARCTPGEVVDLMTARTLTVAMVGFSPGFAYLTGLPEELLQIPRRPRPRPVVPGGSLALANGYAAVYPLASPGGWQLIGRTAELLFTPDVPPYARLEAGSRVQFVRAAAAVGDDDVRTPKPRQHRPFSPVPGARPVFVVEDGGFRTVLQDAGRRDLAALGVPAAGPADPFSFRLANRLVGNVADAGALEATARGPVLRCVDSTFVAVVGASPELRLQGQPVEPSRVLPVGAGQRLALGSVRGGLRSYIAAAGGLVGDRTLGSMATDQLSGIGPGPIAPGQQLWAAPMAPPLGDHLREEMSTEVVGGEPISLRVVAGPHAERFAPGVFASLRTMAFTVGDESNRVGVRLRRDGRAAPIGMAPGPPVELDSQGMVHGAVQVPPDGDPVILLVDHATLGGYPVVAVVASVDHGRLGQCAPGMTVRLVPVDQRHAAEALRAHRRDMEEAVVGRYPLATD